MLSSLLKDLSVMANGIAKDILGDSSDNSATLLQDIAKLNVPPVFMPLYNSAYRYKVAYGGRGGAKSESFARLLLRISLERKVRVLCTRSVQKSIKDSVHKLLSDIIRQYELDSYFKVTNIGITSFNGSEFIFKGISGNQVNSLRSVTNINYCWIEEADTITTSEWQLLVPSIRAAGSEIWISFNPMHDDDIIYREFVLSKPDNALVIKVNYTDNPYLPEVLRVKAEQQRLADEDLYKHIWLGHTTDIIGDYAPFKNLATIDINYWPDYGTSAFIDPAFDGRDLVGLSILYRKRINDGTIEWLNHAADFDFNIEGKIEFLINYLLNFNVSKLYIEATGNSGLVARLFTDELERLGHYMHIVKVNATQSKVDKIMSNLLPIASQLYIDTSGSPNSIKGWRFRDRNGKPTDNDHAIDALASHVKAIMHYSQYDGIYDG
ncbi:MAG: PBSX family phage terminase large subunit [Spirochaetaceae bacterium]|nr:PBSX family phage terminase large subunit [Spirochaetaceae bacterium]